MEKRKESYRRKLPHFQQPGQWYSVTCSLKGAMPKGAIKKYALKLANAKRELDHCRKEATRESGFRESEFLTPTLSREPDFLTPTTPQNPESPTSSSQQAKLLSLKKAQEDYNIALRKYRLAYDKILHNTVAKSLSLVSGDNLKILEESLGYWEGKRIHSHAWCIMSNHFHWILTVYKKDENGDPVYLRDILHSVKLYSARRINANEKREEQLWEYESFDTTIRNNKHFFNVWNYVINNPVAAGLVKDWKEWPGTKTFG